MRIAIVGAGAVGGYFGGRLAEAGEDVVFLARGAHLDAIRKNGLEVESIAGNFQIFPAQATDDPKEAGIPDVVLVAVKAWQVPEAAESIRPMLGPGTFVVPLENGVRAPDQLAAVVGAERVVPGLCKVASQIVGPGKIRHVGVAPWIAFGERDGSASPRVERLRAAFSRAKGVTVEIPADINVALWEKFLFIAPVSGVTAVARAPFGPVRTRPETRRLLEEAMREVFHVARARGVTLPEGAVERTMGFVDTLPPESTPSMQRDVVEGRPSELEDQNGAVVRLGREAGVPTPVNEFLYAALLPQEMRARKS
jgi:2-dehydropantoate 2-reductase